MKPQASDTNDHAVIRVTRELHRRRVLRTAALYIIGTWLVLQVADVLFPGFGIPDAAIRVLLWTAIAGFPLALVFGWFYDIGAGGIRRTLPAGTEGAGRAPSLTRGDYWILAAFLAVAGVLIYNATERVLETPAEQAVDAQTGPEAEALPKLAHSVAVLPFDNISDDPDNELFCDGISEEILNKLSGFRELNVIGRTSSFAFKGSNYGIARISRLLGVRYVLQGSVRKYGEQLRIAAQLVDEGGRQLWSQSFDRELRNIFDIQSEIAEAVATQIASQVVPHSTAVAPPDIAAYEDYVNGREWLHRRQLTKASDLLERAVAADPNFAEAHAELAIALLLYSPSLEDIARAREHIAHALQLKPRLLRARTAQGLSLMRQQPPDYAGAERMLHEVLDQEPNMSDALLWLSGLLGQQGRDGEAFEILQRAYRIDPLHPSIAGTLANEFVSRGKSDEAIQLLQHHLEQPKPGYAAFSALSGIYEYSGRLVEMNRTIKAMALRLAAENYLWFYANYAVLGQWAAAEYWLERSTREFPSYRWTPFAPTFLRSDRGRYDEAVQEFRDVIDETGLQLADRNPNLSLWFGALLAHAGEYSTAIELLEPLVRTDAPLGHSAPGGIFALDGAHALVWSYLRSGAEVKAQPLLASIQRQCRDLQAAGRLHASDGLHYCAENALLQGDESEALSLFEQAVKAGWRDCYIREHDPYWASLRDSPRYRELMSMVKADVDRQSAEVERLDAEEDFIAQLDSSLAASADNDGSPGTADIE